MGVAPCASVGEMTKRSSWVEPELIRALRSHPDRPVIPILVGEGATENVVWPILSDRQAFQAGERLEEKDLDAITHAIQKRIAHGAGSSMGAKTSALGLGGASA